MHPVFRSVASIYAWLFAALFVYVTFTVPMIAATAPLLIAVGLGVGAFFLWPRDWATADKPA